MTDDNQIFIPPSFLELYTDRRRRLTVTLDALRLRYDLCDDVAQQLVDFARRIHHEMGISEDEVLSRCGRGLLTAPAQVQAAESQWIERRLAELLGWPRAWPQATASGEAA